MIRQKGRLEKMKTKVTDKLTYIKTKIWRKKSEQEKPPDSKKKESKIITNSIGMVTLSKNKLDSQDELQAEKEK